MKKISILVCLAMLFLFSGVVLADEPFDPLKDLLNGYNLPDSQLDGIVTSFVTGEYVNLVGINRATWYSDVNGKDQVTTVNVRAEAFIPCYIEMKVTGNKGQTFVQSFGPYATATEGLETNYFLLFDNEVGGFVDENWNSKGHGKNAEVEPGQGVYIQGCDVFKVEVYSNDTYKYQVESAPLRPVDANIASLNANDTLDLHMRTSLDNTPWTAAHKFSENNIALIEDYRDACDSLVAYHQFRVPYSKNTAHGKYEGNIIFRAVTI